MIRSDLDTVWFSDAIGWNLKALDRHEADMIGMNDLNQGVGLNQVKVHWSLIWMAALYPSQTLLQSGLPNAGNLILRPNLRTHRLMAEWLGFGSDPGRDDRLHDQDGLHTLKDKAWAACADRLSCTGMRSTVT